jgi:hypothetical protein
MNARAESVLMRYVRNVIVWVIILAVAVYFFLPLYRPRTPPTEIRFDEFIALVEQGKISRVTLSGETISGEKKDGGQFRTYIPSGDTSYLRVLQGRGVEINVEPESRSSPWPNLLSTLLPILLIVGLWMLMLRQAQRGSSALERRNWLMAENGTLINATHMVSIESVDGRSVVARMVDGSTVVIASNLSPEEARRRLETLKGSLP